MKAKAKSNCCASKVAAADCAGDKAACATKGKVATKANCADSL
jgi:hypothetical protein